jgi:hypothetical protein
MLLPGMDTAFRPAKVFCQDHYSLFYNLSLDDWRPSSSHHRSQPCSRVLAGWTPSRSVKYDSGRRAFRIVECSHIERSRRLLTRLVLLCPTRSTLI